jgi:hypothetical protein|tara:strand:+ start:208 stop:354 length:147 start_codon:yes stop_codon:yes gene_type:complete
MTKYNKTWLIIPDNEAERRWKITNRNNYSKSLNENGLRNYIGNYKGRK